jgi:hypothetical protein
LTKTKIDLLRALTRKFDQEVSKRLPFISTIPTVTMFEGKGGVVIRRADGSVDRTKMDSVEAGFGVKASEIPTLTEDEVLARMLGAAEEMARARSKHFFGRLDEDLTRLGRTQDAEGQPPNPELFLRLCEDMQRDFNEDGTPSEVSIVAGHVNLGDCGPLLHSVPAGGSGAFSRPFSRRPM